MTLRRDPSAAELLADLTPLHRERLVAIARGEGVQATVTLLALMGDRPALAIARFPGPDELTDLGREVAELAMKTPVTPTKTPNTTETL